MRSYGTRRVGLRLLATSLAALLHPDARCGAPFQTDDPNVVATGHVELLAFYQSTLDGQGRKGSAPGLESHFGVFDGVEFDVTTALAFNKAAGDTTQNGYGDTVFGVKYRLVSESDRTPAISIVPKFVVPSGDAARELGNGGHQVFLAAAAEKSHGRFLTYANGGYWINDGAGNRNYWFIGWQMQYQLGDRLTIGGEVFRTTAQTVNEPPQTGFNLGGSYSIDRRNQLLFSAGRGLRNVSTTNRVSTYAGYQISF